MLKFFSCESVLSVSSVSDPRWYFSSFFDKILHCSLCVRHFCSKSWTLTFEGRRKEYTGKNYTNDEIKLFISWINGEIHRRNTQITGEIHWTVEVVLKLFCFSNQQYYTRLHPTIWQMKKKTDNFVNAYTAEVLFTSLAHGTNTVPNTVLLAKSLLFDLLPSVE